MGADLVMTVNTANTQSIPRSDETLFGSGEHAAVTDDQVKAFVDELEVSMSNFDERLRAMEAEPAPAPTPKATTSAIFPTIDLAETWLRPPEPASPQRSAPARPAASAPPPPTTDLLSALAREAEQRTQSMVAATRTQLETEQLFDGALRTLYSYLQEFVRHVNTIQPTIPLVYTFDYRHRFSTLQWSEGSVDKRRSGTSETALLESVSCRLRYGCEGMEIIQPVENEGALRQELHLLNLAIASETRVDIPGRGSASGVRFALAGSIPVQLNFRRDLPSGKLVVRGRNVCAFGLSAFAIRPEKLSSALLDSIGLCLLGRANRLPAEFHPIPFSTKQ